MKALGVFVWAISGAIVTAFIIQYGWNEIIVTIIPVNNISFWQAFGMNVFLSFLSLHRSQKKMMMKIT